MKPNRKVMLTLCSVYCEVPSSSPAHDSGRRHPDEHCKVLYWHFRKDQARLNPVGRNSKQFGNSKWGDRSRIGTWTCIKLSWSRGRKTGQGWRNFWCMHLKIKYISCSFLGLNDKVCPMYWNNDMGSCHILQFDNADAVFFTAWYVTGFYSSIP